MSTTINGKVIYGADSYVAPAVNNPPITSNLGMYFDPDSGVFSDDIGTVAVDGDSIRQISDLSSNGNTLNQPTASSQPTYDIGRLGTGLGSIQSTASQHLISTSSLTFSQPDANFSFYLVFKKNEINTNHYVVGKAAPETGNAKIWLRDGYYQTYDSGDNGLDNAFVANTEDTNLTLIAITINTSGSASEQRYHVYKNGSLLGSTTRDFGSDFRFNTFYGVNFSSIGTAEINCGNMLFYSEAHDSTEVGTMSTWLNDKYSIY